ncbi:hypothetical protein F4780DRAFT_723242 [Xylariomycetidae sp. FL0641]|nr:hypothetical protein F4780DRAFT_723242 [Xylariomycetidae sp. FL0641]
MAPVPYGHPIRYAPLALAGTQLTLIVYLTYAVAASLYTSYKALGPAQDTRSRLAQRKKIAPAFLALALAAFSTATYSAVASGIVSYKTWAYQHGLDMSNGANEQLFVGSAEPGDSTQLYIAEWLSDTPVYLDLVEIVSEKARRFWWGQQVDLATMAFSLLLAVEGRRKKIPMLSAFMVLAHLVNLSFAQNLFYLALLLTPSPLPSGNEDLELPVVPLSNSSWTKFRNKLMPPKPRNWYPKPILLFGSLVLNLASTFLLPYAAGTPTFQTTTILARVSTFLPLVLPSVVPTTWGNTYDQPHEAYASFTKTFRFFSTMALVMHAKATYLALVYNAPDSHYHRHSKFIPWDVEERSKWERTTTALGKVLGSISDHPAVAGVGIDALIAALSVGLWAAVRAANVQDVLSSAIPFYPYVPKVDSTASNGATKPLEKIEADPVEDTEPEPPVTLRRSGRKTHSRVGSVASSSSASEAVATTPSTRKRGRPKKTKPAEEDKAYSPAPSVAKQLVEGDVPPQDLDWESATLGWGLAALGGLASACAGVFGGECVSR